jgi:hypothetical protein
MVSVKVILFSYSNEDSKDGERRKEKGLGRRETTKCDAKRQAHTLSQDHATTLGRIKCRMPTRKEF